MRTISIINLKGGVAKTISSINIAHILVAVHRYKVLLIDNDPQGNASQFFGCYYSTMCGSGDILGDMEPRVYGTATGVDMIDANITLLDADNRLRAPPWRPAQNWYGLRACTPGSPSPHSTRQIPRLPWCRI